MSRQRFVIRVGTTIPMLRLTLLDGQTPVDVSAARSVRLRVASMGVLKVDAEMDKQPEVGVLTYVWSPADTDTVGEYDAWVKVVWPAGVQSFPAEGFFTIRVAESV